jgi:hypothetical protein
MRQLNQVTRTTPMNLFLNIIRTNRLSLRVYLISMISFMSLQIKYTSS